MERIANASVAALTARLVTQMTEDGYSPSATENVISLAAQLSDFMGGCAVMTYDERTGEAFLKDRFRHVAKTALKSAEIFIARLNATFRGEGFLICMKRAAPESLPEGLESLLSRYISECGNHALRISSIEKYEQICRFFLKELADDGVKNASEITTAAISKACLRVSSNYYFSAIRTFLRVLADIGCLKRECSFIVPRFKRPQPMPSVYSVEEIKRMEAALNRETPCGKRNYAMLLLATRLGVRSGDIAAMTLDELDFETDSIRFNQRKTGGEQTLPMLPEIRAALLDYIQNARGDSGSPYVFLRTQPPHTRLSILTIGKLVRECIRDGGVCPGNRKQGPRSLRSSMASRMVNDNVPYEAVRRALGHADVNAIRNYARLDVERLRLYTLEPPAATGNFAEFLSGRRGE